MTLHYAFCVAFISIGKRIEGDNDKKREDKYIYICASSAYAAQGSINYYLGAYPSARRPIILLLQLKLIEKYINITEYCYAIHYAGDIHVIPVELKLRSAICLIEKNCYDVLFSLEIQSFANQDVPMIISRV